MPLYDITYSTGKPVDPRKLEKSDVIKALKRKLPTVTFDKLVRTVDEAIDSVRPSETSKLVWTRAGALFGHHSYQPKCNVDHLWEKVVLVLGEGKECLWGVGMLVRWRIAIRPDIWLSYRRETSGIDKETGQVVAINEYWINENYCPN